MAEPLESDGTDIEFLTQKLDRLVAVLGRVLDALGRFTSGLSSDGLREEFDQTRKLSYELREQLKSAVQVDVAAHEKLMDIINSKGSSIILAILVIEFIQFLLAILVVLVMVKK